MTTVTIYEIFKDSVVSVAAIAAAMVAHNGLQTWKNQLKGTIEYELTRRLLRCVYRYRDAFSVVRNPIMWGGEYSESPDNKATDRQVQEHLGVAGAYEKRWKKVLDARSELETEMLEAEVIWDASVRDRFRALVSLQGELFATLHIFLTARDPRRSEEDRRIYSDLLRKRRDIMYETGVEDDEFAKDVQVAVADLESWLKPHLRK